MQGSRPNGSVDGCLQLYERLNPTEMASAVAGFRSRKSVPNSMTDLRLTRKFEGETEQKLIAALDEFGKIFEPTVAKGTEAA